MDKRKILMNIISVLMILITVSCILGLAIMIGEVAKDNFTLGNILAQIDSSLTAMMKHYAANYNIYVIATIVSAVGLYYFLNKLANMESKKGKLK